MSMDRGFGRSPTFLVPGDRQKDILEEFQRRDQHLSEQYQKHKPLCFNANAYQKTHPKKMVGGHKDADASLVSPMMLGVADGVSQIEEYGMDAAELPNELLQCCEELAQEQLLPGKANSEPYAGPIPLMKAAYEASESLGSTTILLAILDNSTQIHGKLHPMIAVLSIGDCEILILRRVDGRNQGLQAVFHTEMQRIEGNCQSPLQIARVDDRVDPGFEESIAIDVIERGSAVHCLSAYEGDILVMGSDGVFDNLFLDEVVDICNGMMPPMPLGGKHTPLDKAALGQIARRIVEESHAKTRQTQNGSWPDTPIGKGGKVDDTCCVVGEVLEWTEAHTQAWRSYHRQRQWHSLMSCGGGFDGCCEEDEDSIEDGADSSAEILHEYRKGKRNIHAEGSDDEDDTCRIL